MVGVSVYSFYTSCGQLYSVAETSHFWRQHATAYKAALREWNSAWRDALCLLSAEGQT